MNPLKTIAALSALGAVPSVAVIDLTDVGVDEDTVTINGVVFELDTDDTYTAGNVQVDISGSTAEADVKDDLADAINASSLNALGFVATAETNGSVEQVIVEAPAPFTATEALTNGTINVSAGSPAAASSLRVPVLIERAPTAAEVTSTTMHFVFPSPPANPVLIARVAFGGARKYLTDTVAVSGNRVIVTAAGGTNFAATDIIGVLANVSASVS